VLILADGFEENNTPRDVHIEQAGLPPGGSYLLAADLEGAALLDAAKQAIAEVDLASDMPVYYCQTLELRLNPASAWYTRAS